MIGHFEPLHMGIMGSLNQYGGRAETLQNLKKSIFQLMFDIQSLQSLSWYILIYG